MSLKSDVVNLTVNVNGNAAQNNLNELRKSAADLTFELKNNLTKGTQDYIAASANLKQVTSDMDDLKQSIGITALSMKELASERKNLSALAGSAAPLSAEWKDYNTQLQAVIDRQNELKASVSSFNKVQQETTIVNGGLATSFERIFARVGEYLSAFAIFEGIKNFLTGVVEETNKAELASKNLFNSLQNAGRIDLFETLSKQAEDFANAYKAINPEDIKNVFTKLIDYGKLTQSQIVSLTDVIINYAAKQGTTVTAATDVFTQALEGNSRGLKTYGINVKNAATFGDKLNLILGPMADKVRGAEAAFEETNQGALATFKERFVQIQVSLGNFITSLFAAKQSAETVFDEAKQKNEDYTKSLDPLLERYDDLKTKTSLNTVEETELHGIIGKIVEILPQAATGFDKYGVALDINRDKIKSFLKENKQFLAEKEFSAVDEISKRNIETLRLINVAQADLSGGKTIVSGVSGVGGGQAATIRASTPEEDQQKLSILRTLQEKLLTDADILTDKYGKTLPAAVKTAVDAITGEFSAIQGVTAQDASTVGSAAAKSIGLIQKLKDAIKSLEEQLPTLDTKAAIDKNLSQTKDLQRQLDQLENKPNKANTAYKEILKQAKEFYKKLQDLKFAGQEASKSADQKEIDAVKEKYAKILVEFNALQKKLSRSDQSILGSRSDITTAEQQELDALIEKQKKAAFEKDQQETKDNLTKQYTDQQQQVTLYYASLKDKETDRYAASQIDYKTYQANIAAIDVKSNAALLKNAEDFSAQKVTLNGKVVAAVEQSVKDVSAFEKAEHAKRNADDIAAAKAKDAEIKLLRDLDNHADLARANTKVAIASSNPNDVSGQLAAEKELAALELKQKKAALDLEAKQDKEAVQETGAEKLIAEKKIDDDINAQKLEADAKYNAAMLKAEDAATKKRLQIIEDYANKALDLFTNLDNLLNALDASKLQKATDNNTKAKTSLQKELDNKLLSQAQFNVKSAALDATLEKLKQDIATKEAKRQKELSIFKAIIDTASAITAALPNVALSILVGLIGAAEIATIVATPLPSTVAAVMGEGGLIENGPYHKDKEKGLPLVNPRTGKTEMYLEKDEAVIKGDAVRSRKNYTVSGTPSQIASKLNSMHGGVSWDPGAVISMPAFRRPSAQMNSNLPRIMEQGGLIRPLNNTANGTNSSDQQLSLLKEIKQLSQESNDIAKNQKTELHAVVSIKEYREKENQYKAARKAGSISQ